jgi:LysR family glycine cleavage system transcriptional activator
MAPNDYRAKGPHLNALRAFEAAARHENFAAAALELNVTSGAISQHIRTLEDWVGAPLFTRHAQGVRLTDAGRTLAPVFAEAFDGLDRAVRALRAMRPAREIHIAALPSVAQMWLAPRLSAIRSELGDIRLSVTAMQTPPNLKRELFDLSIFIREPAQAASGAILAADRIYPVCAPFLAGKIGSPQDLGDVPLLFDQTWEGDWELWLASCNVGLPARPQGPTYSLYGLAIEEAKAGAGVLIGHDCLVQKAIEDGQLVRLFDMDCPTGKALILEGSPDAAERPEIRATVEILGRGH